MQPAEATAFEYRPTTRLVFGTGQLERLGELAAELADAARVLLVTDPGVAAAGIAGRAQRSLEAAGLAVHVYDGVEENPTTAHVEVAAAVARQAGRVGLICGVGGGSAMDCAKGANFLLSNGGRMQDYWGHGKAARPMLPSIGVPTTAGTGSEAQSYALIADAETHAKMACGDIKARFSVVILDPQLIRSAPRPVRAAVGMDAIAHAVEAQVSKPGNRLSRLWAREAWRLLDGAFEPTLEDTPDEGPWADMLWGAHLAGLAIEHAMLGAAHALANPLTARYGTVHGVAVGLMLPHVVRYNAAQVESLYAELHPQGPEALARRLETLRHAGDLPARLQACGVEAAALPELARQAADQWTGGFNPRPVDAEVLLGLYRNAC